MSMASLLGYFMTMLYNPNNVALEASPLSTVAEIEVGEQLLTSRSDNLLPSTRLEEPMLSMVATRRSARRRSGASVPKALHVPGTHPSPR